MNELLKGCYREGEWLSAALEAEPDTAIDDAAVERSPLIDGPLTVKASCGAQQWIVFGLPDVAQIFPVHENPDGSKVPFHKNAEY